MPQECFELSSEIITPHIEWAKPYYGKKIKALVLAYRYSQRETLELMERMDIDCKSVLIYDPNALWQEGWNWGFEKVKEFSRDYCLKELYDGLNGDYDLIIIGKAPIDKFPSDIIETIKRKVFSGTGLIYIYENPYGGTKPWEGFKDLMSNPTEEDIDFITTGIPFLNLKGFWKIEIKDGKIDLSKNLLLFKYGKGKVVFINWRNPGDGFLIPSDGNDLNYEYYQSFIIKTILWAANEIPKIKFKSLPLNLNYSAMEKIPELNLTILNSGSPMKARIFHFIRSYNPLYKLPSQPITNFGVHQTMPLVKPVYSDEKEILLSDGETNFNFSIPQLPCGKYLIDLEILSENKKINWATIPLEVKKENSVIAKIKVEPEAVDTEKIKEINVKTILLEPLKKSAKLNLFLIDNYDRIISKKEIDLKEGDILIETKMPIPEKFFTILGKVRGELLLDNKVVSIETGKFTVLNKSWDDFTFFAWGNFGNDYISHQRARICGEYGIDAFRYFGHNEPIENLEIVDIGYVIDLWRLGSRVIDKKYVDPCYSDHLVREEREKTIKSQFKRYRNFGLFGFLHGDEFGFIGGDLPGGCHSESCLIKFREFLKNQYKEIENLNKQWDTDYISFDEIMPLDEETKNSIVEKAKKTKNYSYLIDQWLYNYFIFSDTIRFAKEKLKEIDPEEKIKIGCSTPLWNWPFRGYDWSQIMKYIDYFTPYAPYTGSDVEQFEAGRSFAKEGTILSGHYGSYVGSGAIIDTAYQKQMPYILLFNGCSNAFWYHLNQGGETGISPSLDPYPCFKSTSEEINKLKNGIAKLLLKQKEVNKDIAIYWSTPSYLFSFLVSGPSVPWRLNTIIYALEEMGYQYDFISPEQVKNGKLKDYKVFFLPISQCIGKDEAEKIKEFVKNGGILIGDVKTGNFDEHGKIWKENPLSEVFGVKWKDPLQPIGNMDIQFNGEYRGKSFSGPLIEKVNVDTSLVLNGAKSVFNIDGTPFITYNDYGKGTAVCLNFTHADGDWTINSNFRNILKVILSVHDIKSDVEINGEINDFKPGGFIPGFEFHHFVDGDIEYFALTRRHTDNKGDEIKGNFTINFGKMGHLYDVLNEKYIGLKDKIDGIILPYDVKLFSLYPYKLEKIDVELNKRNYFSGEEIEGKIKLKTDKIPGRHVVNIQVKRPDGKLVKYLRQNIEIKNGEGNFKIPIAINEQEGEWEILFKDTGTGIKNVVKIKVQKGVL